MREADIGKTQEQILDELRNKVDELEARVQELEGAR